MPAAQLKRKFYLPQNLTCEVFQSDFNHTARGLWQVVEDLEAQRIFSMPDPKCSSRRVGPSDGMVRQLPTSCVVNGRPETAGHTSFNDQ